MPEKKRKRGLLQDLAKKAGVPLHVRQYVYDVIQGGDRPITKDDLSKLDYQTLQADAIHRVHETPPGFKDKKSGPYRSWRNVGARAYGASSESLFNTFGHAHLKDTPTGLALVDRYDWGTGFGIGKGPQRSKSGLRDLAEEVGNTLGTPQGEGPEIVIPLNVHPERLSKNQWDLKQSKKYPGWIRRKIGK